MLAAACFIVQLLLALARLVLQLLLPLLVGFFLFQTLFFRLGLRLLTGLAVGLLLLGGLRLFGLLCQHLIGGQIVHVVVIFLHAVPHQHLGADHGLRCGH